MVNRNPVETPERHAAAQEAVIRYFDGTAGDDLMEAMGNEITRILAEQSNHSDC